MSLDLTGIEHEEAWGSSAVLPPGRHVCRITEAREGQSSGGYPQIELRMEALSGPQTGFSIGDKQVVTPGSLGKVRQMLEAAGVDVTEGGMGSFEAHVLLGRQVTIFVTQEPGLTDSSKMYSVVASYAASDESGNGSGATQANAADDDIPF